MRKGHVDFNEGSKSPKVKDKHIFDFFCLCLAYSSATGQFLSKAATFCNTFNLQKQPLFIRTWTSKAISNPLRQTPALQVTFESGWVAIFAADKTHVCFLSQKWFLVLFLKVLTQTDKSWDTSSCKIDTKSGWLCKCSYFWCTLVSECIMKLIMHFKTDTWVISKKMKTLLFRLFFVLQLWSMARKPWQ